MPEVDTFAGKAVLASLVLYWTRVRVTTASLGQFGYY